MAHIDFYEKQGVQIFPGARTWLIGNIGTLTQYQEIRMQKKRTVEVPFKWMLSNIKSLVRDKKEQEEVKEWSPVSLIYVPPKMQLHLSDPVIL